MWSYLLICIICCQLHAWFLCFFMHLSWYSQLFVCFCVFNSTPKNFRRSWPNVKMFSFSKTNADLSYKYFSSHLLVMYFTLALDYNWLHILCIFMKSYPSKIYGVFCSLIAFDWHGNGYFRKARCCWVKIDGFTCWNEFYWNFSCTTSCSWRCFISRNQKFPEWVVDYMFSRRIIKKAINQTVVKSLLLMPMN